MHALYVYSVPCVYTIHAPHTARVRARTPHIVRASPRTCLHRRCLAWQEHDESYSYSFSPPRQRYSMIRRASRSKSRLPILSERVLLEWCNETTTIFLLPRSFSVTNPYARVPTVKCNQRRTTHALNEGLSPTDEWSEEVGRRRGQWRPRLRAISTKRTRRERESERETTFVLPALSCNRCI